MIGCAKGFMLRDSVDCAVGHITAERSLGQCIMLVCVEECQPSLLGRLLVDCVRLQLMELLLSQALLEDCRTKTGKAAVDEGEAAAVIVANVWSQLRQTHRLRVVR